MGAMKRLIEDVSDLVHIGDREELEDLLNQWDSEAKVNLLLEAIYLNSLIQPDCECLGHKLAAYRESESE